MPDICFECGEHCPDDERVKAGMKCGRCAYGDFSLEALSEADLSDEASEAHIKLKKGRNE